MREFSGSGASSAPIRTVTVVGSGLMGSGIAQVSTSDCTAIKDYHGLGLCHLKVMLNFSWSPWWVGVIFHEIISQVCHNYYYWAACALNPQIMSPCELFLTTDILCMVCLSGSSSDWSHCVCGRSEQGDTGQSRGEDQDQSTESGKEDIRWGSKGGQKT